MADVQFGAYVAARAAKATLADADLVVVSDSAASNVGKKTTIAELVTNIVTKFRAAFDTSDVVGVAKIKEVVGDVVNSNADTLADVTGMTFPVTTGRTYAFWFEGTYDTTIATNGSRWTINSSDVTTSFLHYKSTYTLGANSDTTNNGLNAYQLPAAANASSVLNGNVFVVWGTFTATASGTMRLQFASETAAGNSITFKMGTVTVVRLA